MAEHFIAAKPTVFQGVQYRSRLEATWAVFLDELERGTFGFSTAILTSYEDRRGPCAASIFTDDYTPDFRLQRLDYCEFIEVKPVYPNQEYIAKLRDAAIEVGKDGFHLLLACGSLYKDDLPILYEFPYQRASFGIDFYFGCIWGISRKVYQEAFLKAQGFRWDLHTETDAAIQHAAGRKEFLKERGRRLNRERIKDGG